MLGFASTGTLVSCLCRNGWPWPNCRFVAWAFHLNIPHPTHWGTLTPHHICPKSLNKSTFYLLLYVKKQKKKQKNCRMSGNQSKPYQIPHSMASDLFTLFAQVCLSEYQMCLCRNKESINIHFWLLTLKAPRKSASENVCLCRLLHLLVNFSNLHFAYRQTVWT